MEDKDNNNYYSISARDRNGYPNVGPQQLYAHDVNWEYAGYQYSAGCGEIRKILILLISSWNKPNDMLEIILDLDEEKIAIDCEWDTISSCCL